VENLFIKDIVSAEMKWMFSGRTIFIENAPIQQLLSEVSIPSDTISLGQGVPFFGPPREAVKAAVDALSKPGYTSDAGDIELREAISRKLYRENKISVSPEENIVVTSGGNQAFMNIILTITNPGDEIILFSPVYFNHIMAVKLASCKPVIIPTDRDYLPTIESLLDALTEKTKAIVTVSPNNPTGAVYPRSLLEEINSICREKEIYHISDEAYEYYTFNGVKHISPASFKDSMNHTITIFSFSKSFGMAGYRIGYIVIPSELYNEFIKVQDTTSICAPVASQAAALEAIKLGKTYISRFYHILEDVRSIFIEKLIQEDSLVFPVTHGGYYFLLKLETDKSDWSIAKQLIEKYRVITIPGSVFFTGYPSLRVSYGNIMQDAAKEGVKRLIQGLRGVL